MPAPESSTDADAPPHEELDDSSSPTVCASCGAERRGTYCPSCGQRHHDGPLSLPVLMRRFVAESFDVEQGFLATLISLTRRPGTVVRDFWRGATKRYMNPVRYFLVFLSLAQFIAWQTGTVESVVTGFLDGGGHDLSVSRAAAIQFTKDYLVLFEALSLPLVVAFHTAFSKQTAAENVVLGLYAYGHGALLFTLLTLLHTAIDSYVIEALSLLVGPAYYATLYAAASRQSWGRSLPTVIFALVLGGLLNVVLLSTIVDLWT